MTNLTTKWNSDYWTDFGERVGSTLIYQLITLFTLDTMDKLDAETFWVVVGLPVVLNALKNLAVNMRSDSPTASVLGITSTKEV